MRELFERAIAAGGLHVIEGRKLWAAYRKYEMGLLMTTLDRNDDEKAKQIERIRSLFQRQLSVPLIDMEQTLTEYGSWEAEHESGSYQGSGVDYIPSDVTAAYEAACHMYSQRRVYEEELLEEGASVAEKLQAFTVFQYALHYPFKDKKKEYLNLSFARVDGIRRRLKKGVCVDVGVLREAFDGCSNKDFCSFEELRRISAELPRISLAGSAVSAGGGGDAEQLGVDALRETAATSQQRNGVELRLLDITEAMEMRPDGHPAPSRYCHPPGGSVEGSFVVDCLHWCLPGPIDLWSELLFQMLAARQ
nr:unnamed protein product [Digitaria exilis]